MSDIDARIEHFRKMANDDPSNELGHLSLGKLLHDASRHEDAVVSFRKVIALNPNLSKAYQLLGQSLLQLGRRDEAVAVLTDGVLKAHQRGEMMPLSDMKNLLTDLGAPVPELKKAEAVAVGSGEVLCSRCGKVGAKMPNPPFSNAQGRDIHSRVCAPCWKEWIGMGTKVINELRLPLSDPQAQKIFDQHMTEFLNLR